jgi:hypothetical protein
MKIQYGRFVLYSGDDSRAKWELKYYWPDGVTVESRYFATRKQALNFAESEGYDNYKICKNMH